MGQHFSFSLKPKSTNAAQAKTNGTHGTNGTNGTNGLAGHADSDDTNANSNIQKKDDDASVSHDNISATLDKYSQVIHMSLRPMPINTADGSYLDADATPSTGWFDDLKALRIKDVETLEMIIQQELSGSKLTDDKTMIMEKAIQLVSNLPPNSKNRKSLTNLLVTGLWDSLDHPPTPQTLLGDKYAYRHADGSYNNPHFPDVGKANTAYARSVPSVSMQPSASLPDCGDIFDTIMDRSKGGFKKHPNNVSSMLYYIASIIIHDCFRTSHEDFNISTTSSYLDLSPLYGSTQEEQNNIRTFSDGKLKPDCFSEKRLLGFPPGVGAILIMFNRYHNWMAEQLPLINEGGRFTQPSDKLTGDKKDRAWKKYDEDIFQTSRLVVNGIYINIILLDYLRTIVNLNRVNSTWTLDPRVDMAKDPKNAPRGVGNQVSCEFNLVYRWYSCISARDEKWTEDLYREIFGKNASEVSMGELLQGLQKLEESLDEDPHKREFAGLKRKADGTYDDGELTEILISSIEDCAGASGALNVPSSMRSVEILGMLQARAWKCATLNEFREHFGLEKHKKFSDINADPYVANQLESMYNHPDFVELYPGLVCEDAKVPMVPGVGIAPTYTISRAILSDAVTLVRGDRFLTTDYTPRNLTAFGYAAAHYDLSINQGCVFYRLFTRTFPNHFKYNSIYAHYPLTIPSENRKIMKSLGREDDYVYERPTYIPERINFTSYEAALKILNDGDNFKVTWGAGMGEFMGKPGSDFMLSGDGAFFKERRDMMGKALYKDKWQISIKEFYQNITLKLLHQYSFRVGKGQSHQVDLIRDIGNLAHLHFASNVFSLPLKSDEHPRGILTEHELYQIVSVIFVAIFFDFDPPSSFPLHQASKAVTQAIGPLVETNVKLVQDTGFIAGIADPIMQETGALKDYGVHMVRQLLKSGLGAHEIAWSQVLPTAIAMVANQAQVFGQFMDYYLSDAGKVHLPEINRLAKEDSKESDDKLLHYVMEGIRMNGTFGSYRKVAKETTIVDGSKQIHLKPGDNAFVSFVGIAHDEKVYPNPHVVDLNRPLDSYIFYGIGPHTCLGGDASRVALTAMLRTIGKLDNLRRAPGVAGSMKTVAREGGFYVYMDEFWSRYWPFPTGMKVQWDGELEELKK